MRIPNAYWEDGWDQLHEQLAIAEMSYPVRCTRCERVYDLGKVTVVARYTDCSAWKCPGCGITVDDRPIWGDHHYVELRGGDRRGYPEMGEELDQ